MPQDDSTSFEIVFTLNETPSAAAGGGGSSGGGKAKKSKFGALSIFNPARDGAVMPQPDMAAGVAPISPAAPRITPAKRKKKKEKDVITSAVRAQLKFEEATKKIRTKTQRLNTYGLFFLETAQQNPAYTLGKFILNTINGFGPHGKAVAGAIAGIVSAIPVIQQTIKNLGMKGGPINQDWKRVIEEEVTGIFTLEEQKRRDLGLDGYIVSPDIGFRPVDETSVYNSQLARDEIRLNKLTQEEKVRAYR